MFNSYVYLLQKIDQTDLMPTERQVVMLTVNRFHEYRYCMAGHTRYAEAQGINMEVVNAICDDLSLDNAKLTALRSFTMKMVELRGVISQTLFSAFFDAGYSQKNPLEIITLKTMSNYTNHLIGKELDGLSMTKQWLPADER